MANQLTAFGINSVYDNNFRAKEIGSKISKLEISEKTTKKFSDLLVSEGEAKGKVDPKRLDAEDKKLYDSCIEMESLLWKQMLNAMKKTINKTKLLDGGQTEEIFTDFLYDEYAMNMAKNANSKITDTLFRQLSPYS